jgi:hypothetical protein
MQSSNTTLTSKIPTFISAAASIGALWVVYQAASGLNKTVNSATSAAANWWVELNSPVVSAQIKIKSEYFDETGLLIPAAKNVISTGYPRFYRRAFVGDRLTDEFAYLVDSGEPVIDGDY